MINHYKNDINKIAVKYSSYAIVAQGQVAPGLHAETGGIDMHVKPAAPVHLHITQLKHPADLLQFT